MTLIIAHRGAGGPENTIAAFERAISLGCDMVEFDVRRSRDGELILFHDSEIDGEEISSLAADKIRARLDYPLATLEEIIELADGRIGLNAEIKDPRIGCQVAEAFDFFTGELIVSSLSTGALIAAKKYNPALQTGLVNVGDINPEKKIKMTEVNYLINYFALPFSGREDLPLIFWTVNNHRRLAKIFERETYGVITDCPERALALRP